MSGEYVVCCENAVKARAYVEALKAVGVASHEIRVVTPQEPGDDPAGAAARAKGVVLTGGPDLDPRFYGEEPRPDANLFVDPPVDDLDLEVLAGAERAHTPTWAICRGLQTFNVFRGGTLWQDIYSQLDEVRNHSVDEPSDALVHDVRLVRRGHPAAELLGRERVRVNSRHHQAIKELAADLIELARSDDGVIEVAALADEEWWVRGVQWHPENLIAIPLQRALWEEFVRAAEERWRERRGEAAG